MQISKDQNNSIFLNISNQDNAKEKDNAHLLESNKKKANSIFAGNLNINSNAAKEKKQQGIKNALKTIMDQYANDRKTDKVVEDYQSTKASYSNDLDLAAKEVLNARKLQSQLKDTYGIADDSTEQKDMELLEKSIYSDAALTEDELTQLNNMGSLTDYQKDALRYSALEAVWVQRVENANNGIENINKTITGISLAKLKTHPMVHAQEEAATIIESATKEALGIMLEDGKEKVDATIEENKEKSEKMQEIQEEKEAKKEAAQEDNIVENRQIPDNVQNAVTSAQSDQLQLLDELNNFIKKQKVLEEDIKGIAVDEQV